MRCNAPCRAVPLQARLAEVESTEALLRQQVVGLKEEKGELAAEVEGLRAQLAGRGRGSSTGGEGGGGIVRDWKTEEIERLRREVGSRGGAGGAGWDGVES